MMVRNPRPDTRYYISELRESRLYITYRLSLVYNKIRQTSLSLLVDFRNKSTSYIGLTSALVVLSIIYTSYYGVSLYMVFPFINLTLPLLINPHLLDEIYCNGLYQRDVSGLI